MSNDADANRAPAGAGRGLAATLATRGTDALATYGFYSVVARHLSVAGFGVFVVALAVQQFAAALARQGLDQALLTAPPGRHSFAFAARRVFAASAAIAAIGGIAARFIAPAPPLFVGVVASTLPLMALAQLTIGALRASQRTEIAAIAEGVAQPVTALVLALAAMSAPSLTMFAIVFGASWIAPLLFAVSLPAGANIEDDRALVISGRSLVGVYLLGQAMASADVMILGALSSAVEVARYAVAQKITAAFTLVQNAVSAAAGPTMRAIAADRAALQRYQQMLTRWTVALCAPLLALTLGAPELVLRLFGSKYGSSATVLIVLSLATLPQLMTAASGTLLICTGNAQLLLRLTMFAAAMLIAAVAIAAHSGAVAVAAGVLAAAVIARSAVVAALWRFVRVIPFGATLLAVLAVCTAGAVIAHFSAAAAVAFVACGVFAVLYQTGDVAFMRGEFRRAGPRSSA